MLHLKLKITVGLQYTCMLFTVNQLLFATILFHNLLEMNCLQVTDFCDQDAARLSQDIYWYQRCMYLKTGLQREIIATTRLSRTSQIFLACEKLVYYFITIFFPYYMYINRVNVFQCIVVVNFICNLFYIISGFHCGHGFLCEVFLPLHINAWTRMGTGLL